MAAKFNELPPHLLSTLSLPRRKPPHFPLRFFRPFSSSLRSTNVLKTPSPKPNTPAENHSSWIKKWPSPPSRGPRAPPPPKSHSRKPEPVRANIPAIDRIVLRLRNLGVGSDEEEESEEGESGVNLNPENAGSNSTEIRDDKLGDLLERDWVRPDTILAEDEGYGSDTLLPWERGVRGDGGMEEDRVGVKKPAVVAPTLAELTLEVGELKRLRGMGMTLREKVNVPKAGITGAVLEKIHGKWRKSELVRLKFHEELAHDMKTGHKIVERRTGGLVIWRSGSVMVVFRGTDYKGPISTIQKENSEKDALFVPSVNSPDNSVTKDSDDGESQVLENPKPVISGQIKSVTEEEAEYINLLDGLGPRFEDWWGTGILPVDADLLPEKIPGYKTPFRLLPNGLRPGLTNAEMTNFRKLAKSLPCHFALGRNRNHQGLARSIVKLWEKSLLVKIAVKRGIQNTNNKLMAEELKTLTGGILLLRNKYYIVMYRGKDFIPPTVATSLTERQEFAKQIQDVEEKVRVGPTATVKPVIEEKDAQVGTLAEFYEAQARWGMDISAEERERMIEEASNAQRGRVIKRLEHKVARSQAKKLKAEKLLSKIVESWVPISPSDDQETITDEEKVMYRKVGLKMKAFLPLGIRGVFDGVIENMHLHWKHRELVKLISKEKQLSFVEESARLLEYESGGILVAIVRVSKGHALIYYRGKNYQRPITLRPRNLLNKPKALKRRVALQRYEALSQHISELEKNIEQTKREIGKPERLDRGKRSEDHTQLHNVSELDESEDEPIGDDDEDDSELDDDEDDSELDDDEDNSELEDDEDNSELEDDEDYYPKKIG